jgi:hypothetical protein
VRRSFPDRLTDAQWFTAASRRRSSNGSISSDLAITAADLAVVEQPHDCHATDHVPEENG